MDAHWFLLLSIRCDSTLVTKSSLAIARLLFITKFCIVLYFRSGYFVGKFLTINKTHCVKNS
jgi:hypothetical protein